MTTNIYLKARWKGKGKEQTAEEEYGDCLRKLVFEERLAEVRKEVLGKGVLDMLDSGKSCSILIVFCLS